MRKTFAPLFASLLLCGAATMALSTAAQAQTLADPNVMLAQNTAPAPAGAPGMGHMHHQFSPEQIAAFHKARCQDHYAREVGRIAYLETKLNLTGSQQSLFAAWKAVKLDIAKRHANECAARNMDQMHKDVSPADRLAKMEERLKKRVADIDAERPALAALYGALSEDQRKALHHHHHRMGRRGGHGMWHHGMMGHGMMGQGMHRGPMNGQQPPAQ
jgi:hypothetical protein